MPITSKKPGSLIPPFVTLAGWQLQRMWGLLLTVGLGMLAAMVVVCVAPLYSQVATTAGLRDTLDQPSTTQTSNTIFSSDATRVQSTSIRKVGSALDQEMHQKLGPYLGKAHLSLETSLYTPVAGQSALTKDDLLRFVSEPMDQTQQHLTLTAGQLPQARPGVLEVALTTESARLLHVKVGSTFAVTISSSTLHERIAHVVQLRVSGLFLPTSALDPFWHGNTFLHSQKNEFTDGLIYSLLASNDALISTLQQSTSQSNSTETLELPIHLYWLYSLDSSRITSEDLDTLLNGFNAVQTDVA
ncbi:MAG: hypothetical protein J2P36_28035, partial [Ktedonobacteraceae bacterium]|nr:hypothetical protein [Ktedonobacteraceae bacterium]